MGRTCGAHGENRNPYRILVTKPEGKRPVERPKTGGRIILRWILRDIGRGWHGLD
jgi:hypothetical protein